MWEWFFAPREAQEEVFGVTFFAKTAHDARQQFAGFLTEKGYTMTIREFKVVGAQQVA